MNLEQPTTANDDPGVIVGDDGLARPVWASSDPLMQEYYDTEWGMPVHDEQGLFERLSLEAFQAGLSWATLFACREQAGLGKEFRRYSGSMEILWN